MKEFKRLGKLQKKTLNFYRKYPGWNEFHPDTRGIILSLQKRGLLEVNRFQQARISLVGYRDMSV